MFVKIYNFFLIFCLSFYSKRIYNIIYFRVKGYFISYLLFLSLLYAVSLSSFWYYKTESINLLPPTDELIDTDDDSFTLYNIISQLPPIKIDNGIVQFNQEQPFFIYNTNNGEPLIIIDTTGKVKSLENSPAFLLLTRTELLLNEKYFNDTHYILAEILPMPHSWYLDQAELIRLIEAKKRSLKWMIPLIFLPFSLVFNLFILAIKAALFGFVGILLLNIIDKNLDFRTSFRIASVSFSPIIMLQIIDLFYGLTFNNLNHQFMYFAISVFYFIYALTSIDFKNEE